MLKPLIPLITAVCLIPACQADTPINITLPLQLEQNAFLYTQPSQLDQPVITQAQWTQKLTQFKARYFYPWSAQSKQTQFCYVPGIPGTCQSTISTEEQTVQFYQKKTKPGYGKNYQKIAPAWLQPIVNNMDLATLPNIACTANQKACLGIMVHNAQVRSLPTVNPFYDDFTSPGEGYPFDYIQLADLWLGTPVQMVQHTLDHKWLLVKSQGIMGWVPTQTVATVTPKFVTEWQAASTFATPLARHVPITLNQQQSVQFEMGSILPLQNQQLVIPIRQKNGTVSTTEVSTKHLPVINWPLTPTPRHFAEIINALSGMPYGWGGKNFDNDCSGLLRRLFVPFGIWIPRASYFQANYAGKKYSLYNKTESQRKAWLINGKGRTKLVPFMTLISVGNNAVKTSHIGLYLGTATSQGQKIALMFNSPWGILLTNTKNPKETGRALVAQSLISPVGIGDPVAPALLQQDWQLNSLWQKPGMNITLLTQQPNPAELTGTDQSIDQDPMSLYLLGTP